jgi:sterol 24-C-methyltransferase
MSKQTLPSGPEADHQRRVTHYFRKLESRLSYRLLLGGTKHFGYYPTGSKDVPMETAMRLMEDKLGETLALPPGSYVLDAGSGEGDVAIRMASRFGLRVEGVDLIDFNVRKARRKAQRSGLQDRVRFHRMDYSDLRFPDHTFDAVYTMETLVHAFDHKRALQELHRVIRPGGRIVLFEYSTVPRVEMAPEQGAAYDFIVEASAMSSLPFFLHDSFPAILGSTGFVAITVEDITQRMTPMLRRLAQILYVPYQLGKLMHIRGRLINCAAAVESYKHKDTGVWRYNVVTAARPL